MILIFSENRDQSTSKVIEWLRFYNIDFKRINTGAPNPITRILIKNDKEIDIALQSLNTDQISCIWYRRGYLSSKLVKDFGKFSDSNRVQRIISHLEAENKRFFEFIYSNLNKNSINNPIYYNINKLEALNSAKVVGLNIPDTLITSQKLDIVSLLNKHSKIVCKPISDILMFKDNSENITASHTIKIIDKNNLEEIADIFEYSLFQVFIDRKFEIRIFYIDGRFFSLASIPLDLKESEIGTSANGIKFQRLSCFEVPAGLKDLINTLMNRLGMRSGSLDFIYGMDQKFYFLEVNPVGQFDYVSFWGNYHIEHEISNILCNA